MDTNNQQKQRQPGDQSGQNKGAGLGQGGQNQGQQSGQNQNNQGQQGKI